MKWSNLITPSLYPDCVSSPQDAEAQGQIICLMLQQYLGPRCPISLPKLFLFRLCDQLQYFPPPIKSWINLRSRGRQVLTTTCSRQGGPSQPANPRVWRWDGGGLVSLSSCYLILISIYLFPGRWETLLSLASVLSPPPSLPPLQPGLPGLPGRHWGGGGRGFLPGGLRSGHQRGGWTWGWSCPLLARAGILHSL